MRSGWPRSQTSTWSRSRPRHGHPSAKLMDYGKFKYESALKARESRKNQAQTVIKEIKLRPKIDPHDYGTKRGHVERFLRQGDKVKVTIMFRGREQSRPELGFRLLQRLAADVEELGFVEAQPKQDGRNMIMVIGPHRRKSDTKAERAVPREGGSQAERPTRVRRPRRHPPRRRVRPPIWLLSRPGRPNPRAHLRPGPRAHRRPGPKASRRGKRQWMGPEGHAWLAVADEGRRMSHRRHAVTPCQAVCGEAAPPGAGEAAPQARRRRRRRPCRR